MFMTGVFRLGKDAEVRHLPSGQMVTELSCVYEYGRKGNDGKRPSQWVNAALWGDRGEKSAPYLKKGGSVFLALSDVHIEEYESKNGKGSKLVARVSEFSFIPGAKPAEKPEAKPTESKGFADLDDDVPF